MNIDLDDSQKMFLLETLATALAVAFLQKKDVSELEKLIQIIALDLKNEGKMHIFERVFEKVKI